MARESGDDGERAPKEGRIAFRVDGKRQISSDTWFRGDTTNFNPKQQNMRDEEAVSRHVLHGWLPDSPQIGPETKITAFGSCFASNIVKWLRARDFTILTDKDSERSDAYVVRFGEGMVNTFVIRQQFEWALEGKAPEGELWHGYDTAAYGYDEDVRRITEEMFRETDTFILTLGLSEIWYDEVTGGVFWRAVPQDKYDPSRHKFRVSTVSENKENLLAIYALIREHCPNAKVIFTLSPIPLVATFRPVSCMTANSVSKSVLRAAIDEFLREVIDEGHAFYWPSYEIVMDVFADRWREDRRHVKQPILDFIMTLFEQTWCRGAAPRYSLLEAWLRAQSASGVLPIRALDAIDQRNGGFLERIAKRIEERGDPENAALLRRLVAEYAEKKAPVSA